MTRSSGHSSHHSRSKSAKYDDRRDRDRDLKSRDREWDRQYYSDRPSNSSPTAPYLPPSNSHSRPSHSRRSSNQTTRTPPSSRHHASASVSHLPPSNRDRPAASRSQTQIAIPPTGRQKLPTRSNTSPAVAYPAHGNQPYVHSGKQPLVVPIGGGQYVVVPPKGTRMEMMVSTSTHSTSSRPFSSTNNSIKPNIRNTSLNPPPSLYLRLLCPLQPNNNLSSNACLPALREVVASKRRTGVECSARGAGGGGTVIEFTQPLGWVRFGMGGRSLWV
ncbi:hypothetical protein PTI98_007957 [Pleurotus ostreatus]|nr:hypothetical protein PTI98_007957 [Pleurotus ostreatus]